ncbi:LTA synthase family protein [Paenibacillus tarimensis]
MNRLFRFGHRNWTKPFVIFSAIMLFKIYLTWFVIFEGGWTWKPLITDILSVWVIFCLIELMASRRKLALYMAVNLLLTSVFFAAIMYYKYYGVIVTYHALMQVNQVTEVKDSVFSLIDPQYMLIFIDIIVLSFWFFAGKSTREWRIRISRKTQGRFIGVALICLVTVSLANIWPHRASMNELNQAAGMGLLNYEAYTILKDKKEDTLPLEEITPEAIRELKGIAIPEEPELHGAAAGKNVIIVQLEAFQSFLLGLELEGREVTPNMNELISESYYFNNFYQQVGQGNTSDAEFVVNTSLYIPVRGAASQVYGDKELPSLPKLLRENGYHSVTFHTNDVKFWNRDEMYKAIGFDKYYDQPFFGDEDIISFGPSDEVLYERTAEELQRLSAQEQPFYAHIIAVTAHHPFKLPEHKLTLELPEEYQGTFLGDYLTAQHYADYAFGLFVDDLKARGLWDNSLVLVYGDHLGLPMYSLGPKDRSLLEDILGRVYSYSDMLNIPLAVSLPGVTEQRTFTQLGGQSDVLPTVANLLGIDARDRIMFGQDLLNQQSNLLPQRYYLPSGSFLNDAAVFVPGNGFHDGTIHQIGTRPIAATVSEEEYNRALELLRLSDSFVRQLPKHTPE